MWLTFQGQPVEKDIRDIVEDRTLLLRGEGRDLKICIGTDSQKTTSGTKFATALVFVVKGNGGFMYVRKRRDFTPYALRERMMLEIAYSIETAYEIEPIIRKLGLEMEIHADINQNPRFPSHASYNEAMGYIKSMGYTFVAKPDAFAASGCADIFCH